ncbi:hypothetical protein GPECTOR_10g1044 [Gonium pectorale]|uniref:AP2/ERF domain-containing protein n=1 Tax=Gonium pectorale TaxID=33097 RepID=A0A150GQE4_GONPE|nr:hypothetical protein GPECTOR_10g1044 [Gonium pectorale]|eukprot:KXZ52021.1 hypothetical protein GPECTOR_10g1044 [Gonium pectorale]
MDALAKASSRHSLFKGVTLYKPTSKWRAQVEAARVFDRACICKYGKAAVCNFPIDDYKDEMSELHGMGIPALLVRLKEERQRKKALGGVGGGSHSPRGRSHSVAPTAPQHARPRNQPQPLPKAPPAAAPAPPPPPPSAASQLLQQALLAQAAGLGLSLGAGPSDAQPAPAVAARNTEPLEQCEPIRLATHTILPPQAEQAEQAAPVPGSPHSPPRASPSIGAAGSRFDACSSRDPSGGGAIGADPIALAPQLPILQPLQAAETAPLPAPALPLLEMGSLRSGAGLSAMPGPQRPSLKRNGFGCEEQGLPVPSASAVCAWQPEAEERPAKRHHADAHPQQQRLPASAAAPSAANAGPQSVGRLIEGLLSALPGPSARTSAVPGVQLSAPAETAPQRPRQEFACRPAEGRRTGEDGVMLQLLQLLLREQQRKEQEQRRMREEELRQQLLLLVERQEAERSRRRQEEALAKAAEALGLSHLSAADAAALLEALQTLRGGTLSHDQRPVLRDMDHSSDEQPVPLTLQYSGHRAGVEDAGLGDAGPSGHALLPFRGADGLGCPPTALPELLEAPTRELEGAGLLPLPLRLVHPHANGSAVAVCGFEAPTRGSVWPAGGDHPAPVLLAGLPWQDAQGRQVGWTFRQGEVPLA